ncbi:TPA: hypothetical protein SGN65_000273 [Proteus mirabilis]|uniref:hypothetical protein n=1 Tax=Proteus mirabilis TaxID=584 RepID=UPI00073B22BC|nr:hypothetical protein [Proteus mirabilis]KSW21011.1 hypothetical protein OL98_00590 [Proteus mirabilis]HDU8620708.1 hypothetical protein [Proteus mirabilis]HEH1506073.1 hypothetical protein [Proteus mirabilis]HEJ9447716.1 hypothetical protein [Proteus mirabilis]HEK3164688.1 hypothetical protein [Proteus mirabilis]
MNRVNGIDVFNKGIELSTKKDYLGSCYVTFAKNIKDISNTTAKPSFIKKVIHMMERFTMFFAISQTGRMGISNRDGDLNRYNETRTNLENKVKDLKCKIDEFNNKLTKKDTVDREKDEIVTITAEYHNLNHFLSLIENENSSFKDRYSFFNYLNELQRAEAFCRSSSNTDYNHLADEFENIIKERVERIKKEDVIKIFNEVLIRYDNETRFKNSNERILANFSSNKEKENFLSKINFLVCVSKYNLPLMVEVEKLKEEFPVQLREIMNKILYEESIMGEILNEANIDCVYKYSLKKVQNIWIEEYINKFYGGKEIIIDKSTDDNVAYFVGGFEWDDFDGINNTNNDNMDSKRNLSEVSEIIQGKLNKYVKGDGISDLTSILEQIELDKLGGKETYTLISILKEIERGKLGDNEIYTLISTMKGIELDKLEWDEIYTLISILKGMELDKLEWKEIYNLISILKGMELGKLESKEIYNLISILKEIKLGQLGLKEIYTLIPILKGLELGKLESNEIYTLIPLLKEIEQGKLIGEGIYNLTYIQKETELDEDNISEDNINKGNLNKDNIKKDNLKYADILELMEEEEVTQLNVDGFSIIDSNYAFSSE